MKKIIHYCWFGGNELPDSAIKCINSWKKYCPDYEIKEWNESNFDVSCCRYVKEAYNVRKWAFVSDFARFKILYEEGGIYFDTDVELIRSIDDIVMEGPFMGNEIQDDIRVAPGLGIGADAHMTFLSEIIEDYMKERFILNNGSYNQTTVVDYTTNLLKKHGLKKDRSIQKVMGFNIYPSDYFCPFNFETKELVITKNTRSIHHYDSSWYGERELFTQQLKERISKYVPKNTAGHVAALLTSIKYDGFVKTISKYIVLLKGKA